MLPIPGSLGAVRELISLGYDVWIATQATVGAYHVYGDKVRWIQREIPELSEKIIVTPDKSLLGDRHDFLCDARPHKANCQKFAGRLLMFSMLC